MIWRYPALCIVFILSLCFVAFTAAAQPTLPDINGVADTQGIVTLTWNCQYNGLKSISVLRSYDGANYATIGNVQHIDKGIQNYVDTKPAGGNNFYRLSVVFSSGLKWSSNDCKVYIKTSGNTLGLKDTVTFPITSMTDPVKAAIKQADTPVYNAKPTAKVSLPNNNRIDTPASQPRTYAIQHATKNTPRGGGSGNLEDAAAYMTSRKKLVFSTYDTDSVDVTNLVLSHFIYTDPVTGNINIEMPGDWNRIHYSVSFYNDKGMLLYNIPHINAPGIIMDKRNFQKKGTYKFVIRTAIIEFEEGYLSVVP